MSPNAHDYEVLAEVYGHLDSYDSYDTVLPPSTTPITESPSVAPPEPPSVFPCQSWCPTNLQPWENKCTWSNCVGCVQCAPSASPLATPGANPTAPESPSSPNLPVPPTPNPTSLDKPSTTSRPTPNTCDAIDHDKTCKEFDGCSWKKKTKKCVAGRRLERFDKPKHHMRPEYFGLPPQASEVAHSKFSVAYATVEDGELTVYEVLFATPDDPLEHLRL